MNRDQALAVAQSIGLNGLMSFAGRSTDDTPTGYGPALDRSFGVYIGVRGLTTTLTTSDVATADVIGFTYLLQGSVYDLILPFAAITPDMSVDAPLTNVKFSQTFRALQALRDSAWQMACSFGYCSEDNTSGMTVVLDFNESSPTTVHEFG